MDLPLIEPRRDVALVVLCGGRGRRLGGVVKPLLAFADGTTLLARTLARLGPRVAELWISATEETAGAVSRSACAPVVLDPGRGPARALGDAAGVVRVPWILLVGGDQPSVGAGALAALGAAVESGDRAVAPRVEGRRCPLPGLYARDAVRGLGLLDDRSLQSVLDALVARQVEGLGGAVVSVNTAEEARGAGLVLGAEGPDHPAR